MTILKVINGVMQAMRIHLITTPAYKQLALTVSLVSFGSLELMEALH